MDWGTLNFSIMRHNSFNNGRVARALSPSIHRAECSSLADEILRRPPEGQTPLSWDSLKVLVASRFSSLCLEVKNVPYWTQVLVELLFPNGAPSACIRPLTRSQAVESLKESLKSDFLKMVPRRVPLKQVLDHLFGRFLSRFKKDPKGTGSERKAVAALIRTLRREAVRKLLSSKSKLRRQKFSPRLSDSSRQVELASLAAALAPSFRSELPPSQLDFYLSRWLFRLRALYVWDENPVLSARLLHEEVLRRCDPRVEVGDILRKATFLFPPVTTSAPVSAIYGVGLRVPLCHSAANKPNKKNKKKQQGGNEVRSALSFSSSSLALSSSSLRVISWNPGSFSSFHDFSKLHGISADVFCLQEVRVIASADKLQGMASAVFPRLAGASGGGTGFLWSLSLNAMKQEKFGHQSASRRDPEWSWLTLVLNDGRKIALCNAYFPPGVAKSEPPPLLLQECSHFRLLCSAVVLCGDFNLDLRSSSWPGLLDARILDFQVEGTHSQPMAGGARSDLRMIDFVLIMGDVQVSCRPLLLDDARPAHSFHVPLSFSLELAPLRSSARAAEIDWNRGRRASPQQRKELKSALERPLLDCFHNSSSIEEFSVNMLRIFADVLGTRQPPAMPKSPLLTFLSRDFRLRKLDKKARRIWNHLKSAIVLGRVAAEARLRRRYVAVRRLSRARRKVLTEAFWVKVKSCLSPSKRDSWQLFHALVRGRPSRSAFSVQEMNDAWRPIISGPPPDDYCALVKSRCLGVTKAGKQCRLPPRSGSYFCRHHAGDVGDIPPPGFPDFAAVVRQLLNWKAVGVDGVPNEAFKLMSARVLVELGGFVQAQLFPSDGSGPCFPDIWKKSLIVMIGKPPVILPLDNRPITLLSCFAKFWERAMYEQLRGFCPRLLNPGQGGFRDRRGCREQVWFLALLMEQSLAHKRPMLVCFLDIKKAFDSVPFDRMHAALAKKLGKAWADLLIDWLMYHRRQIRLEGNDEWFFVLKGGPQGSVIFPLIFCIWIDSLLDRLDALELPEPELDFGLLDWIIRQLAYADDLAVPAYSQKNMVALLLVCEAWSKEEGIQFSPSKTEWLGNRYVPEDCQLTLYGEQLKRPQEFRYLGVLLAFGREKRKLPEKHASEIESVLRRTSSMFGPGSGVPVAVRLKLLRAELVPKLCYGCELLPHSPIHESLYVRIMKIGLGTYETQSSTTTSFYMTRWPPLAVWEDDLLARFVRDSLASPYPQIKKQMWEFKKAWDLDEFLFPWSSWEVRARRAFLESGYEAPLEVDPPVPAALEVPLSPPPAPGVLPSASPFASPLVRFPGVSPGPFSSPVSLPASPPPPPAVSPQIPSPMSKFSWNGLSGLNDARAHHLFPLFADRYNPVSSSSERPCPFCAADEKDVPSHCLLECRVFSPRVSRAVLGPLLLRCRAHEWEDLEVSEREVVLDAAEQCWQARRDCRRRLGYKR